MQTTQTAHKITLILNTIKNYLNDFELKELSTLLKQNNCPYWNRISTILIKRNLITKSSKGRYDFISSPIYYSIIECELINILKKQKKYTDKWKKSIIISEEQQAIEFLKSLGYKIFKEM